MRNLSMIRMATAICIMFAVGVISLAVKPANNIKDEVKQSQKSARVFSEIMHTPDKAIPRNLLDSCECVAVFPSVLKAGFIVGARGGRGVASCRTAQGWSAPAYFNL